MKNTKDAVYNQKTPVKNKKSVQHQAGTYRIKKA